MMDDAPIDRDAPEYLEKGARNAFYESLAPEAKERFLRALRLASASGMGEQGAWREAVVAAQTAYGPLPAAEDAVEFDEKL